jgi:hypothetical protein
MSIVDSIDRRRGDVRDDNHRQISFACEKDLAHWIDVERCKRGMSSSEFCRALLRAARAESESAKVEIVVVIADGQEGLYADGWLVATGDILSAMADLKALIGRLPITVATCHVEIHDTMESLPESLCDLKPFTDQIQFR